jgi:hypothetical protein
MSNQLRISAKTLGEVALPSFCPRCFWIKLHVSKLPYQIFPGIFSSIDSYTKRVIHGWFDERGSAPPWLQDLGDIAGYEPAPHFSQFFIEDRPTNIMLTGMVDEIFLLRDNSYLIVDYKTAKYTSAQDTLMPLYVAQLNAYAYIGEQCGFKPISGLALVYMEPVTHDHAATQDANLRVDGFAMGFSAYIHPVGLDISLIPSLFNEARRVYDLNVAPPGGVDCKDCALVEELTEITSQTIHE